MARTCWKPLRSTTAWSAQKVPCDGSIQVEDVSLELDAYESTIYRSLVGMAIYLSQERLDTSFTVKELAAKMSKPITAMSRVKKLLGYLKQTKGYSMKLRVPGITVHYKLWLRLGELQ